MADDIRKFLYNTTIRRVTNVSLGTTDTSASFSILSEDGIVSAIKKDFYPFCWARAWVDRNISTLESNNVSVLTLSDKDSDGSVVGRMASGYCRLLKSDIPMSYKAFEDILYSSDVLHYKSDVIMLSPEEQVMFEYGIKMFAGIGDYGDLHRVGLSMRNGVYTLWDNQGETEVIFDDIDSAITHIRKVNASMVSVYGCGDDIYNKLIQSLPTITVIDGQKSVAKVMRTDSRMESDNISYVYDYYGFENKGVEECRKIEEVECAVNQTYFHLAKVIPVPFHTLCMSGMSHLWRSLMLYWSYCNGLAVPSKDEDDKGIGIGGLSKVFRKGYCPNVIKIDYNSFYPNIVLSYGYTSCVDVMCVIPRMLSFFLSERARYVDMSEKSEKDGVLANTYMGIQKAYKLFANALYGSISSNYLEWNDMEFGRFVTSTGRLLFRKLLKHFSSLGYQPTVGTTDGCNFMLPDTFRYDEGKPYEAKGGFYTGYLADIMEYNANLKGSMSVSVDDIVPSSIVLTRNNYAEKRADGSVKMVGGIFRSRGRLPYLNRFMEYGCSAILDGRFSDVVTLYGDMVKDLYNYNMPLSEIMSDFSVVMTQEEYDKALSDGTMQPVAVYECLKRNGMEFPLGDVVHYVNTGEYADNRDMDSDGNLLMTLVSGDDDVEYNSDKYISMLATVARKLLVCVSMRSGMDKDMLFPTNPRSLVHIPQGDVLLCAVGEGADSVDDVLVMEDKEVVFWQSCGKDIPNV